MIIKENTRASMESREVVNKLLCYWGNPGLRGWQVNSGIIWWVFPIAYKVVIGQGR
jgi:hypothetical protein